MEGQYCYQYPRPAVTTDSITGRLRLQEEVFGSQMP